MPPPYQPQPAPALRRPEPVDLLSAPLDSDLPSAQPSAAAPPIPPNPEKDALLQTLSQTLVAGTHQVLRSNRDSLAPLMAQRAAMAQARDTLLDELSRLERLEGVLDTNERVIRGAMLEAERVMHDAAGRARPEVDDVLVCATAVGAQLYALVAEERACAECRLALGRALDAGRVAPDAFVKQTRSLAREEFLKKALVRKIARGMGLDEKKW
jgi:ESCRT-I complex subunit TSG101